MRKSFWAAFTLLLIGVAPCHGSPPQESVAEAARKAREQKKSQPKSARVFTNDDLSTVSGRVNIIGSTSASVETGSKASVATEDKSAQQKEEKGETYWRKRFAEARAKLRTAEKELDILQRELNLLQQQYYADPTQALLRQYDRKDINEQIQKIEDKKKEVEQLRRDLSDLEDELRRAGGDPGWSRER